MAQTYRKRLPPSKTAGKNGEIKNARHEMRIESHYGAGKRKAVGFNI